MIYPIVIDKYYEPELIASAFDKNYERYRIDGDKSKELAFHEYLNIVRLNVKELIEKNKILCERKVQLIISIMFINHLTDVTTERFVCSDNIIIRPTDDSSKATTDLYNSLLHRYQETLENKMEGSSFVFDYINFIYIKFNQIDLIRGWTYIETPAWLSKKTATINPKNDKDDDNICFMNAITVALNHQEIADHPERISEKLLNHTS